MKKLVQLQEEIAKEFVEKNIDELATYTNNLDSFGAMKRRDNLLWLNEIISRTAREAIQAVEPHGGTGTHGSCCQSDYKLRADSFLWRSQQAEQ